MRRYSVLLLALAMLLGGCDRGTKPTLVGSPAPEFTVQDADRTVSLRELRGRIVVLNFWATWCPPCIEEMPSLTALQSRMKDQVVVLAISLDENEGTYRSFLENNKINLLTVRDPQRRSSELYGTFKYPETYIIDRNGILRRKFVGALDWTRADVIDYLNKL
ncbi:MAG TPA: TlpA disulfide reductase family protein [Terriglobales bacterium]|jgi:peroxiredoxin|nr:TlpA disulfide reductase family protein [Terriglobales bacterium]